MSDAYQRALIEGGIAWSWKGVSKQGEAFAAWVWLGCFLA